MNDFDDFGGPVWAPDLLSPDGRLSRLCKGGGAARQAAADSAAAREQSALQHKDNMKLAMAQLKMAQAGSKPIKYLPQATQASASTDVVEAGRDYKRRALKRFGNSATVMAAAGLGGPTPLAA